MTTPNTVEEELHNKKPELHNNSGENSEKVTSIQDQKADEIKNSDGNESKSECCNPIITEADEIDAIWYKTQDFYSYRMDKEMFNAELLALKERWEREARMVGKYELLCWMPDSTIIDIENCCVTTAYDLRQSINRQLAELNLDRIAQLGGKE